MVDELPPNNYLRDIGPAQNANEIPSVGKYYDGSLGLNVVEVNCFIYTVPNDCVNKPQCGTT